MDINTRAQQDSRYPSPRFNEKGCLQVWGGDALSAEDLPKGMSHPIKQVKTTITMWFNLVFYFLQCAQIFRSIQFSDLLQIL